MLSVIELITKFVGALSFDVELPSSTFIFVEFLQLVNAHAIINAATIAAILENCFIKSLENFTFNESGAVCHQSNNILSRR